MAELNADRRKRVVLRRTLRNGRFSALAFIQGALFDCARYLEYMSSKGIRMSKLATSCDESSARVSALAFQATPRFTLIVGRARERISLKQEAEKILKDVIDAGHGFVSAWQNYLNVDSLHSEPCLKAAFTTVTETTAIFGELCNLWDRKPSLWSRRRQEMLVAILEQVEDVQDNLAVLIDDDARNELRNILTEAGLDGHALVREDAKAG
jgi:hypothetical protein